MARSIRISVARALASGSGTMLAPSLPLLRLPDRGTADRNPNQPITARKSHRCSLSQATKAFLDEFHEFLVHCRDNGMRYSLARFGVANAAVCQNLIERAVIEDRTIECFRIPFRHHRQLQCPRLSNEVHCAMAKQP